MTTLLIIFLIFVFLMGLAGLMAKLTGHWIVQILIRAMSLYCLLMSFYLLLVVISGIDLIKAMHA